MLRDRRGRGPGGLIEPLFVDSDSGLGSPAGDVDDGFALVLLFGSGCPVGAVASVFGNTPEPRARANHQALARLCGYRGPIVGGARGPLGGGGAATSSEAARLLASWPGPLRVLALGPLTNLAAALQAAPGQAARVREVIGVGSNLRSRGRWPPLWPHEFNLTGDRAATRVVFESGVPLTLVPLDVARGLTVTPADLATLTGPVGDHLRRHSRRWFRRALWVRGRRVFPVWDLLAAVYAIAPSLVESGPSTARLHPNGWVEHGAGDRPLTVVRAFDRDAVWRRFRELAARLPALSPAVAHV